MAAVLRRLAAAAALATTLAHAEPASTTVWDYIVVGAGTGGSWCAGRLAASGAEVLLLEAGRWDYPGLYEATWKDRHQPENIWAYPTDLPKGLSVQNKRELRGKVVAGRIMGGSSAIHGDVYDRPPAREFEYAGLRSWHGARVEAAFARIEAELSLVFNYTEELDALPIVTQQVARALVEHVGLEFLGRREAEGDKHGVSAGWTFFRSCSSPGAEYGPDCRRHTSYSDSVPKRNSSREGAEVPDPKFAVLAQSLVSRVLLGEGEALGVELIRHGRLHEAYARRAVVLAAGALGTPKILMLSGIGDPLHLQRLGIPVRVANREVGYNLADHLAQWLQVYSEPPEFHELPRENCAGGEKFHAFLNLTGPPSGGDGLAEAEVRFFSSCDESTGVIRHGVEAVLLRPESRGRVVVTSSHPEVLPSIEFPQLWQRDFDRLAMVYEKVGEAIGVGPEDWAAGRPLAEVNKDSAYLYQHFCCSARAAPRGEAGVCDEDLMVRGVRGLFVADCAALPFPPSAHTSAPALLMGEFAAGEALKLGPRRLPPHTVLAAEPRRAARERSALRASEAALRPVVPMVPLRRPLPQSNAAGPPVQLPMIGLGTGNLPKERAADAVATFIVLGGRHLDLAVMYDNYGAVREGISRSGLRDLSELVLTWKVMPFGGEYVLRELRLALDSLGLDRIDVAALHWPGDVTHGKLLHGKPLPECVEVGVDPSTGGELHSWRRCRVESYNALAVASVDGSVRALGVSNFAPAHIDDLTGAGLPLPAVHQLELSPLWHEDELLRLHADSDVVVQAYACLGGAPFGAPLLREPGTGKIAKRHSATPAQVLLRWATQRGAAVITGGSTREHLAENLDIFRFELTEADVAFLDGVGYGQERKMYGPMPQDIL